MLIQLKCQEGPKLFNLGYIAYGNSEQWFQNMEITHMDLNYKHVIMLIIIKDLRLVSFFD